jgi:hypothetical protein
MTMDVVRAKYGPPSEAYPHQDGTATWFYYTDKLGLGGGRVDFDVDGRVAGSWNK